MRIARALLSVSDKTGLVRFARALEAHGVVLLSTGGTARALGDAGIRVTEVSEYTGFPEMLDGRVKTLHPAIHGAILARRDARADMDALEHAGFAAIDLVVVNLYPFVATVARPDCTLEEAIENVDIGGPAMIRAAAKNHAYVTVVTDAADYQSVLEEMERNDGAVTSATRFDLARKAFAHTAAYDKAVATYLGSLRDEGGAPGFPVRLNLDFERRQTLRYGENPHQEAAFYREAHVPAGTLAQYRQLQGKELSYNNIADADAAWECVKTLQGIACVVVKHANPCGVAVASSPLEAYRRAFAGDPEAAFGGIIAFNQPVDETAARAVSEQFVEVIIAPGFDSRALQVLATKAGARLLEVPLHHALSGLDYKRVGGGLLVQTPDARNVGTGELRVVTERAPTEQERDDLLFAWRVAKFVKSNAIVFARDGATVGIGAGQMSRADSARIAVIKAANAGLCLRGSAVASDAFFPFRDGLDLVAEAGATVVVQPGGSVRDAEVIAAADERGIAMVFTGVRHFRH